jgi:hypothetical protein
MEVLQIMLRLERVSERPPSWWERSSKDIIIAVLFFATIAYGVHRVASCVEHRAEVRAELVR